MEPDIILKDEGDFASVTFKTTLAQEAADDENILIPNQTKHRVDIEYHEAHKIIDFADNHHLSIETDLTVDQLNQEN